MTTEHRCYKHQDKVTDVQCEVCQKFLCEECIFEYNRKIMCEQCKKNASPGAWSILIDRIVDALT